MKIRKLLIAAGISISLLNLTSCDLLVEILEQLVISNSTQDSELTEDSESDGYLLTNNENVFFVQVNNSKNKISYSNTGYVKTKSTSREIEDNEEYEVNNSLKVISSINNDIYMNKVRKLNNSAYNFLLPSVARDAESDIKTTIQKTGRVIGISYPYFYEVYENNNEVTKKGQAKVKAHGKYCNVLFINDTALVSPSDIDFQKVADNFDSIYQKETAIVGSNIYSTKKNSNLIDPYEKIDVIVADIMEVATEKQNSGVFGYFNSTDFVKNGEYSTSGSDETTKVSTSNEMQTIYVDSYFLKTEPNQVYSTLVHEFNHLLNFCQKTCFYGLQDMESWYTEMLSMVTEDLFQHYLTLEDKDSPKNRLSQFDATFFYGFEDWQDGEYVYCSYANAYGFGAYLVRNFGGVELLHQMATNAYTNKESVTNALAACGSSFNYSKALRYFPMIMINCDIDGNASNYSNYITLNRSISYDEDSTLYFDALNMNDYKWTDTSKTEMSGPNYLAPNYVFDLYPSGFNITKVCKKSNFITSDYEVSYINPESNPDVYTYFVNFNKIYN